MFRWSDSEFIVEAVMPDFGHIVPVVDDTMLNGIVQLEDTLLGLSFFSNIDFFIIHANHDVFVLWSADN